MLGLFSGLILDPGKKPRDQMHDDGALSVFVYSHSPNNLLSPSAASFTRAFSLTGNSLGPFSIMSSNYPAIQPGGSLIVAWQVKDKRILVVGGGEVSETPLR